YNNMYGAGYNPYIYGGGYGMPYGHYGNPYGMSGINSNIINRKNIETEHSYAPTNGNVATNETETNSNNIEKPKKVRAKRAKNIDTYAGVTVQSNINTMGESKISKFFKEKFNNLRNKVRKQTNEKQNIPDMNNQNNTDKLNNSQDNFKQDDSALQPTHLDETSNLNEGIINPDNILENPMLNSDDNSDLNLTEQRQIQAK
ncbi:MAG: hypothetical protein IJA72_04315, partial [Clostridia bacterium]|nr:hypothetical protein [Clostridia bacterium]